MGVIILSIVIIVGIFIVFVSMDSLRASCKNPSEIDIPNYTRAEVSNPKIGSEVSEEFFAEIHEYCSINSLTVSDLIRKSVRFYIDSN